MAKKSTEQAEGKSEHSLREEKILQFWKDNKIFEKSLEKESPKGDFVFYDGPPFATGLPHYGHILPGTVKDVIPRYKTMRGYHVSRRWGWDCHGLPIENLVEKELGLDTKKDIEKFGIAKFNSKARDSVLRFEKDWKEVIPRTGRWIDMDNAYKTMDSSYTESVWWSFKNLYDKGLVYKSFKPMHLCPHCETTLSNFEVNQGYKDITDISVYVKFELKNRPNTYVLAWTTTPWTLPGNMALAVRPGVTYVEAKKGEEKFILFKDLAPKVLKDGYEIVREIPSEELVGERYKTLFDYYQEEGQIYEGDFVNVDEGTGIVHIAPAFGEDDYNLSLENEIPFVQHVGMDGRFKTEVRDFAGDLVKPRDGSSDASGQAHQTTDIKIIKHLANKNLLFAKEKITHSYPHCWRCDTPLINYAAHSWFVKVTDIKDRIVENNKNVKWVPEDIRDGRFGKWLEGARDWAISRSRFWGTPLPVWQNDDGSKMIVVDSLETLRKYSKTDLDPKLDLHRPYIDEVVLEKNGEQYRRIPDVFDTWYDSGSVPFASRGARDFRPADFIAEGLDQTRGWFYTLIVLSTALFGESPYKQVVVNGLILAEDGRKMSKKLKNYPELSDVLNNYGADALRYYLISSQAVRAEDLAFSEKGLDEIAKKMIGRLYNTLAFYELYFQESGQEVSDNRPHILDKWIDAKLAKLIHDVTSAMEHYELDKASRPLGNFVDDLSTWYLRRSRNRPEALPKLRQVLIEFSKLIAPFMPFMADDIYLRLKDIKGKNSVHLEDWPKGESVDENVLKDMNEVRKLASLALEARSSANIKVRQPLAKLEVQSWKFGAEYKDILKDEINVKEILENPSLDQGIQLDTELTPELLEEGKVRDSIRTVQDWRKTQGLKPGEKAEYKAMAEDREFFKLHKLEIEHSTDVELIED